MIRDFVAGLAWGTVVSAVGLGVISQVAAPPGARPAVTAPGQVAEAAPENPVTAPAPLPEAKMPEPAAPAPQEAPAPAAPPPAADSSPTVSSPPTPPSPAPSAPSLAPPPAETAPAVAPQAPSVTGPAEAPPAPAQPVVGDAPAAPAGEAAPAAALATPGAPGAGASEEAPARADLPPPAPGTAPDRLLEPAAQPAPAPEPASIAPMPEPEPEAPAASTLPADPGLAAAPGVTVGRLPAIGAAPEPAAEPEMPAEADLPPLQRYAALFENPTGKPLFALILLDDGSATLDRAQLAALPFPVTFVIDPLAANAAEAAATYRAAGHEVVMLASGIPEGATAADIEQTFQALASALPEAVAVIDLPAGGFQDDRKRAAQVVPILKAQGRGLITYERGLNAADQVARREDLPAALIFRQLDAEGEAGPVLRRYLDRAAFKAAQEGRVAVVGSTRPETVAAILEWTVEGRAASVALAPATAVLSVN